MDSALASDVVGLKTSAPETVQLQGFPAEGNTNVLCNREVESRRSESLVLDDVNAKNSELDSKVFSRDEITSKQRGKFSDKGFKGRKDKDSIMTTGTVSLKGNGRHFLLSDRFFLFKHISFSNWISCPCCCNWYPAPRVVFVFSILSITFILPEI